MFVIFCCWLYVMGAVENAVLDPALYLSPSPPLRDSTTDLLPAELWSRTTQKIVQCVHNPPVLATEEKLKDGSETMEKSENDSETIEKSENKSKTMVRSENDSKRMENLKIDSETMEKSETFWPFVRSPEIRVEGVHIPLTFSVSGTYDKLQSASGVIATSYLKIPGSSLFGNYGRSGLAGSGYGKYPIGYPNVKVYSGNNQPAWGGWGNGKWGHYGKG